MSNSSRAIVTSETDYEPEEFWDTDVSCDEEEEYYRQGALNPGLELKKKDFLMDYQGNSSRKVLVDIS